MFNFNLTFNTTDKVLSLNLDRRQKMNIVQNNDCIWIFDDPCHACHQDSFPLQQNISLHECQTTSQKENQLAGCVWMDKQFIVLETHLVYLLCLVVHYVLGFQCQGGKQK